MYDDLIRRHGDIPIRMIRAIYGRAFAIGAKDEQSLADALRSMDKKSAARILSDHNSGVLAHFIRAHS